MATSPSNKLVGNKRNTFKMNSKSRNHYGRGSGYRETSNSPPRSFKSNHMNTLTRSNVNNYGGTYTAA